MFRRFIVVASGFAFVACASLIILSTQSISLSAKQDKFEHDAPRPAVAYQQASPQTSASPTRTPLPPVRQNFVRPTHTPQRTAFKDQSPTDQRYQTQPVARTNTLQNGNAQRPTRSFSLPNGGTNTPGFGQPPVSNNIGVPPTQFRKNSSSFQQSPNSGFQPSVAQVEMTALMRAVYLIPTEAAKPLEELFAHKATSLVECRTEDCDAKGLIKFVVTAEPATQDSIQKFIAAIFPQKNIDKLLSGKKTKRVTEFGQVLVAADYLDTREFLSEQNVKIEQWPIAVIPEQAATKLADIDDMVTMVRVSKGTPITMNSIADKRTMSEVYIPEGHKVVAVKVSSSDTACDLLQPGDKVDLVGYFKQKTEDQERRIARTFQKGVKVFSVNHKRNPPRPRASSGSSRSKIVSLLVTSEQAEQVFLVQKKGEIKLVLRGDYVEGDDEVEDISDLLNTLNQKTKSADEDLKQVSLKLPGMT